MSLNTCTLLFLSIPSTTLAFSALLPRQQHRRRTVIVFTTEKDLTFNPAEGYRSVNLPRANYCAEHFGVCSLEEIEDLRDSKFWNSHAGFAFSAYTSSLSHYLTLSSE